MDREEAQKSAAFNDLELEKNSSLKPDGTTGETELQLDPAVVKSLKRKADWILTPLLAIAYLMNSLDRSNVANANTAGLEDDLGMEGRDYNNILMFYYVPLVVCGPFATMLTKSLGAKYTMSLMLFVFGIASIATGWVRSYNHLAVCRAFVGAFEAGFLSSTIYYLSIWYTRKELASRVGIFYAAQIASSAFGGLLAYGMFQVTPSNGYFVWSYLFFLEGGMTVLWAFVIFFLLPINPQKAWFLNQTEKDVCLARIQHDSVASMDNKFNWKEAVYEFTTPHGYIRVFLGFLMGVIHSSNSNFLVMLIRRLGRSVVDTQLFTIAPALTGAIALLILCKSSDYFRERGGHSALADVISLVGYIMLITVNTDSWGVLYFAIFLCTIGAYPSTPITAAWMVSNIPNLNARAFTTSLFISIGNCGSFVSSNIFLRWEAPRYGTALRVNIAMAATSAVCTALYGLWMRYENRRRDKLYGKSSGATEGIQGTKDSRFRFHV